MHDFFVYEKSCNFAVLIACGQSGVTRITLMSAFISAVIGNVALNGIKQIVLIEMNNLKCLIMWLLLATTIMPTMAENGTKLEAEDANYTNCTLVRDSRYSRGRCRRAS